jgi:uncharacterized NAD(P)/FAD-binding protein YdhS
MTNPKHIVIVGGGFCGTMTAVNLIRNATCPLKITIVNSGAPFRRGVAFISYSETHLLNVAAGKMSAFPDDAAHFTNWVHSKDEYSGFETGLLEETYLPRNLYGEYLLHIWDATLASKKNDIEVSIIEDTVIDLEYTGTGINILLEKKPHFAADYAVLATGNALPRNPEIKNMSYYSSPSYYKNPWNINAVSNLHKGLDVLIIGNGLTMVDTVIGLIENGFTKKIYSLSTNGFGVLPHRHFGLVYKGLVEELEEPYELSKLFKLIHKHIKKVRKLGISAGPVIDSIRPYSQKIWQSFTDEEKKKFLKKLRYLWGVARHRLPILIYDIIKDLRINGQLLIYEGKLIDIEESDRGVTVTFYNGKEKRNESILVERVINCTGPETSIYKTLNPLLRNLAEKGIISSDPLELGINADISTYHIINAKGQKSGTIFTLGTNLKGLLWETIAVPELRVQSQQLSKILLEACEGSEERRT